MSDKVFAIFCSVFYPSLLPTFRPPKKRNIGTLLSFQGLTSFQKGTLQYITVHYTLYHHILSKHVIQYPLTPPDIYGILKVQLEICQQQGERISVKRNQISVREFLNVL